MEFTLYKASDWEFIKKIKVDTLKGLQNLSKQYNRKLVIDFRDKTIIIYDDYLE